MDNLRQSTAIRVRVVVFGMNGAPLTSVPYTDVTKKVQKQNQASAMTIAVGEDDWTEIVNLEGEYDLMLSASDTDTLNGLRVNLDIVGADETVRLDYVVIPRAQGSRFSGIADMEPLFLRSLRAPAFRGKMKIP